MIYSSFVQALASAGATGMTEIALESVNGLVPVGMSAAQVVTELRAAGANITAARAGVVANGMTFIWN